MLHFIRVQWHTPGRRAAAVFAVYLLLLWCSMGTVWQARVIALFPAGMACVLFLSFLQHWQTARIGLIRWEVKMIRSWRIYARKPPVVEALYALGIALALLSTAAFVAGMFKDIGASMMPALGIFAVAGVCEITVQARRVFKQAWAPIAGKVIALSLGVMVTAVTVSAAKHAVHSLAHVDPKYMTELTAAVAAGLLPLACLGAAGALLCLLAVFQMFLIGAVLCAASLLAQAKPLIGDRAENHVRLLWYRVRTGRRPPGGVVPRRGLIPQYEVALVGSALSKLAVVLILVQAGQGIAVAFPGAMPILAKAMVGLEYRPASGCTNINPLLRVLYMDDGNVSVARLKGNQYTFTVEKCEHGRGG